MTHWRDATTPGFGGASSGVMAEIGLIAQIAASSPAAAGEGAEPSQSPARPRRAMCRQRRSATCASRPFTGVRVGGVLSDVVGRNGRRMVDGLARGIDPDAILMDDALWRSWERFVPPDRGLALVADVAMGRAG